MILLPVDPDASAAVIRAGLRERAGVEALPCIATGLVYDRPFRRGTTDVRDRGGRDRHARP